MIKKTSKTMYAVKHNGRILGGITNPYLWSNLKLVKDGLGKGEHVVKVKITTEINMKPICSGKTDKKSFIS